jgi:SNF family Na+-dependent transporter
VWSYGSTGAVPFLSMLAILTLWFGISVPLVFLGNHHHHHHHHHHHYYYHRHSCTWAILTLWFGISVPLVFLGIYACIFGWFTFFVCSGQTSSLSSSSSSSSSSSLSSLLLSSSSSSPSPSLGAYFGYKKDSIEFPVITSNIPRQIPDQAWYLNPVLTCLLGTYILSYPYIYIRI